ncbi:MAG: prolyl oligopeptidase family serine peptidase [Candidatus Zhuqueibacterota bacterium]
MKIRQSAIFITALVVVLFCTSVSLFSQTDATLRYQLPAKAIVDIIDAQPTPAVRISPDKNWLLILEQPGLPTIEELSRPELRLAGIRIDPNTNGPSRARCYSGLILKRIATGEETRLALPADAKIDNLTWSPDSKRIAFTLTGKERIDLWIADVRTGHATQLATNPINDAYGAPFYWVSDSKTILCKTVPQPRTPVPAPVAVPTGPVIQENIGKKAPAWTFQDLLKNPYDEQLFDYYVQSELIKVSLDGSSIRLGQSAVYSRAEPSPDGRYILVEKIHRPYSYLVPAYHFPMTVEILDIEGRLIRTIAEIPLAEELPSGFDAVRTGPRSFDWRADAPATLVWTEAQDGGDPRSQAEIRDKVFMVSAPFDAAPAALISLNFRFDGIAWGTGKLALASESWWKTRRTITWLIQPDNPKSSPKLLVDRSYEDRYSDPGDPVRTQNSYGVYVLQTDKSGKNIFLTGNGASPEGDFPFFDMFDVTTGKTKRLWQSHAPYFESASALLDAKKMRLLLRRESVKEPPNYYVYDIEKQAMIQLTHFPHPTPQLMDVQKEIIRYKRDDGVDLTATLYLPANYKPEDGPLPMLMWAYPQEFKSAQAAGQMSGSPYQFIRIGWSSPMLLLTQGYAVLDGPTMPIIGQGEAEPNDTFVGQLVASAKAAIDEVVRRGVTSPDRIAISGHSYGAFMTANLLAHSDLFRTGVARSGAYNRTLTPFGFQSEERTYWEAPAIYNTMSPFMHADKINEPILLIHGQADNNSGTFPIQSERFYNALKGHGATARLVLLPNESHGYQARESVLHVWWETITWLDAYLKQSKN